MLVGGPHRAARQRLRDMSAEPDRRAVGHHLDLVVRRDPPGASVGFGGICRANAYAGMCGSLRGSLTFLFRELFRLLDLLFADFRDGQHVVHDEAASPAEFIQAMRIVHAGSVWAPSRVLSIFIERVTSSPGRIFPAGRVTFTDREKEVLELLVVGRSNKEIGSVLGIEERTVKAHVAKLMRKVGVQNRIALSVHAITHSLVTSSK